MARKTEPQFYCDITRVDEESRMVWGYGTREDLRDSYGTIIDLDSVRACLPEYLQWRNVREMHQPSAVGTAEDITVDEIGVQLGVHVVDDAAWNKVQQGVYKGFSIGGKKDYQDGDRIFLKEITEFSLVDRPANAGCTIDSFRLYNKENDMEEEQRLAAYADVQRYAGEEISDARTALEAMSTIFWLLNWEESEAASGAHPEAPEQVASLKAAIANLKKFVVSELKEDSTNPEATYTPGATTLLELAARALDVTRKGDEPPTDDDKNDKDEPDKDGGEKDKEKVENSATPDTVRSGSRHSAADQEQLNGIKECLRALGVTLCDRCAADRVENAAGSDDDVQRHEDTISRLQGEADTLRAELDTLRAENEALKAEPEPAKGVTRVVGKEDDSPQIHRTEEPPKDAADAIKRVHAGGGQTFRV